MVPEFIHSEDKKLYGDELIYGKKYFLGDSVKGGPIPAYYFGQNGEYFLFFSSMEDLSMPVIGYKCYKDEPLIRHKNDGMPQKFKISSRIYKLSSLEKEFISKRIRELNPKPEGNLQESQ